jgi:hypothetical protein
MKNFNIPYLLFFIAAFAFTSVSAQTQKPAVQKASAKSESIQKQAPQKQSPTATPVNPAASSSNDALITDGPVLNDAVINVKDEKQYMEQKKKALEEKNKSGEKSGSPK